MKYNGYIGNNQILGAPNYYTASICDEYFSY